MKTRAVKSSAVKSCKRLAVKIGPFVLGAAVMMMAAGCATGVIEPKQYSGFLKDYSGLEEVKFSDGRSTMRWMSSDLTRKKYSRLFIEPIVVYPEPTPDQVVDPKLLEEAARYLGLKVRHQLRGGAVKVVEKKMDDTIRMRAAITTVETRWNKGKDEALVPMAMLVAGADDAKAGHGPAVDVYLEVELTDMNTGKVLARSVKKGVSNRTLQNSRQVITFEDVRPVLDLWAADAQRFTEINIATK